MKKLFIFCGLLLIFGLSSLLFFNINTKVEQSFQKDYIRTTNGVTIDMLDINHWITDSSDKLIMNVAAVSSANQRILDAFEGKDVLVDLSKHPTEISDNLLFNKINADINYDISDMLINGQKSNANYYKKLRGNYNLNKIKATNKTKKIEYAICVQRANMRSIPTDDILTDTDDLYSDYFQETAIYENEPVLIFHESSDKKWLYAQAKFYRGWVKATAIARCKSRQEWLSSQKLGKFLLITGDKVFLQRLRSNPQQTPRELTMGTRFSLVKSSEAPPKIDGRDFSDNYVIKMPIRNEFGYLDYSYMLVPAAADVHIGYLPYTAKNLLRQMFKNLGNVYGWGDMYNSHDCSSMARTVFSCFGFCFPRNSAYQAKMPFERISLTNKTVAEKIKILKSLPIGSLLHFKGHIAIYLGCENQKIYVFSTTGSYYSPENHTKMRIATTSLIEANTALRSNGRSWLEEFQTAVIISNKK